MIIVKTIGAVGVCLVMTFYVLLAAKILWTNIAHWLISRAIGRYQTHLKLGEEYEYVSYFDMEDEVSTIFRFWDWGYKHILPPEEYERVKKYIWKK